jgi:hypothetical protein
LGSVVDVGNLGREQLERIDHDVADTLDFRRGNALACQVLVPVRRGRPQEIADGVRRQTVDLLGHAAVAAAQPRLEVSDRNQQLRAHECARQSRVHVADDDDPIGPRCEARLFVLDHHAARLLGVAAAAYAQMHLGLRHAQIREERVGHVGVVVLARVHDARSAPRFRLQRVVEGRDLHEVRARGGDEIDSERSAHWRALVGTASAILHGTAAAGHASVHAAST